MANDLELPLDLADPSWWRVSTELVLNLSQLKLSNTGVADVCLWRAVAWIFQHQIQRLNPTAGWIPEQVALLAESSSRNVQRC